MMTIILGIVRVLVILLIIRLVVSAVRNFMGGRRPQVQRNARMGERAGGTLVRDPQCGTYLPESRALTVGSGPDVQHFCSAACRDAWASVHGRAGAKA